MKTQLAPRDGGLIFGKTGHNTCIKCRYLTRHVVLIGVEIKWSINIFKFLQLFILPDHSALKFRLILVATGWRKYRGFADVKGNLRWQISTRDKPSPSKIFYHCILIEIIFIERIFLELLWVSYRWLYFRLKYYFVSAK